MKHNEISQVAELWSDISYPALRLEEIPFSKLQELLHGAYKILYQYHKEKVIPKEIAQMLLNMDEYLYFASVMEEHEVGADYYLYRPLYRMINSMKEGFFGGEYPAAYPKLQVEAIDIDPYIFDFEKDILKPVK